MNNQPSININESKNQHVANETEHSLSKVIAAKYGQPAAVLLKYLSHSTTGYGKEKDGKKWFRVNLDHMAKIMPYLSRTRIAETLKKLSADDTCPLTVHHINKRGYDRTGNYAFRDQATAGQSRTNLRYFRPTEAKRIGIPGALILHNLRYWQSRQTSPQTDWVKICQKTIGENLGLSPKQVRSALKTLIQEKLIERRKSGDRQNGFEYRVICRDAPKEPIPDMEVPFPDMEVPFPDMEVPFPDMEVPNPDNDISYQKELSVMGEQRRNYSERPAKPPALIASPSHNDPNNANLIKVVNESSNHPQNLPTIEHGTSKPSQPPSSSTNNINESAPLIWPATFQELLKEVYALTDAIPADAMKNVDNIICQKLTTLIEELSLESLEDLLPIRNTEDLYSLFQSNVESIDFADVNTKHRDVEIGLRKMFMTRLVETFMGFRSVRDYFCCVPYTYDCYLKILNRMQPRFDAAKKAKEQAWQTERFTSLELQRVAHRSKDSINENDPSLPTSQKLKILKNGIHALNQGGWLHIDGSIVTNKLDYNKNSLQLASKLFDANPDLTPGQILQVMDECGWYVSYNLPKEGYDPDFILRKGTHLSSLIKEFSGIAGACNLLDEMPPITPIEDED